MVFSIFWNIVSRSRDNYTTLAKKLMTSQTVHMTVINHKIENIENIGWVSFKLGSHYLGQVTQLIIPSMRLP